MTDGEITLTLSYEELGWLQMAARGQIRKIESGAAKFVARDGEVHPGSSLWRRQQIGSRVARMLRDARKAHDLARAAKGGGS